MCIAGASTCTGNSGETPGRPGRCNRLEDALCLPPPIHLFAIERLPFEKAEGRFDRKSEDLPFVGHDETFLGEVRVESRAVQDSACGKSADARVVTYP